MKLLRRHCISSDLIPSSFSMLFSSVSEASLLEEQEKEILVQTSPEKEQKVDRADIDNACFFSLI